MPPASSDTASLDWSPNWSPKEEVRPQHGPETCQVWLYGTKLHFPTYRTIDFNNNSMSEQERKLRERGYPSMFHIRSLTGPTSLESSLTSMMQQRPDETDEGEDTELEEVPLVSEQWLSLAPKVRARAGMDCGAKGCCQPCRRSTCGSPWPTDLIEAQIAACRSCQPPCPPPCCSMRYCPCPPPYCPVRYYPCPAPCAPMCPVCPPQFNGNRQKSGSEQNKISCIDPCDCTGSFDVEEAMHHKYRDVSKDQCGLTKASENECRQRRQYGDCPPNCPGPCAPWGQC